jgi:hypothetical protein
MQVRQLDIRFAGERRTAAQQRKNCSANNVQILRLF